jgi:hypothetical protein
VTTGLVLRYDLGQTSGTAVTDTSGNSRNGVLNGDASWSAAGGLTFGGTNGYVKLPNNVLAGLSQITVSADVYIDSAQSTPYMIWAMGNTGSDGVGNGYLFATGNGYKTSIATGNWTTEQGMETAALPRGVWASISYTLDSAGVASEYLNGVKVASKTGVTITPGAIGSGTTTANYLGRSVYTADKYFKGQVKNFRIYNRALSAAETADIAIPDATRVAGDKAGLTLGIPRR